MSSIKTNFEFPRGDDPIKQGQRLAQTLSSNFKAIVNALSLSENSTVLSGSLLPIGTVLHSMLTLAQIQSQSGSGWILADGGSCSGSTYESITGNSTVPDMTGRFLRGKGANNPDGDLSLGVYTSDKVGGHNHRLNRTTTGGGTSVSAITANTSGSSATLYTSGYVTVNEAIDNETAPKSITVNIFIRIN